MVDQSVPGKGEVEALALQQEQAEAKTLSLAGLIGKTGKRVDDATAALANATKVNKGVGKSDERLRIAKLNQVEVKAEAVKLEKLTEVLARRLREAQVKRSRGKLAEYRSILKNTIEGAKAVVDGAENTLSLIHISEPTRPY
eukprot:TRINITY_DN29490_c0_g1_i1.p1 TRINITY_DN29490_c0_g1~~TRINITY_DN29490_c0_g1_i1.p1  ORF type:complete len:142 (-),score=58.71 TRINITY_DN29490_c0_g1_i1:81-506(-)